MMTFQRLNLKFSHLPYIDDCYYSGEKEIANIILSWQVYRQNEYNYLLIRSSLKHVTSKLGKYAFEYEQNISIY